LLKSLASANFATPAVPSHCITAQYRLAKNSRFFNELREFFDQCIDPQGPKFCNRRIVHVVFRDRMTPLKQWRIGFWGDMWAGLSPISRNTIFQFVKKGYAGDHCDPKDD
jgi:hypothetical protein